MSIYTTFQHTYKRTKQRPKSIGQRWFHFSQYYTHACSNTRADLHTFRAHMSACVCAGALFILLHGFDREGEGENQFLRCKTIILPD